MTLQCASRNVQHAAECRNGVFAFTVFVQFCSSLIAGLLYRRSPSAILRAIRAAWIDSVDTMFFAWPKSHVCKEVCKMTPAFAYRNASPSVSSEIGVTRVCAAHAHCIPYAVFTRTCHAVRPVLIRGNLPSQTTARFGSACRQVCEVKDFFHTARAFTKNSLVSSFRGFVAQNSKAGEGFFNHVGIVKQCHVYGVIL